MKEQSIRYSQRQMMFPFSELPSTLQAEISTKLAPKEFSGLLQSSKVVNRNLLMYASLSCDIYYFEQQQNMIKNFLKDKITGYSSIRYPYVCLSTGKNKRSDILLKEIYDFNLSQENKKVIFPTNKIKSLIKKTYEYVDIDHQIEESTLRLSCTTLLLKDDKYGALIEPCLPYIFVAGGISLTFLFGVFIISYILGKLIVPIIVMAVLIIPAAILLVTIAALYIFIRIKAYDILSKKSVNEQLREKKSNLSMEISPLVNELSDILINVQKEPHSHDIIFEEEAPRLLG